MLDGNVLIRDAAVADGTSSELRGPVSVLVQDGRVAGLCATPIDATGATLVPGLVDLHGHVTMAGGARHFELLLDDTETLLAVAERVGEGAVASGVRWVRDAGSVTRSVDGEPPRALNVTVRERWRGRRDRPTLIAAGAWIICPNFLPTGIGLEAADASELVPLALGQLDAGADWVKLYLQGPTLDECPWTAAEVREVVAAVHDRGARVMAHAMTLVGASVAAAGGVDTLEHGFELDAETVETMVANDVVLVTTLSVPRARTDYALIAPWCGMDPDDQRRMLAGGQESARLARDAGVTVVAGSDQGGGGVREGQLPLELECLVEAGFTPTEALAAATWGAGDVLGLPEAGRIRVGDPATFLLVDGNPLEDPRALWRVWLTA
jgi:imidazolonepropionase-like amidohydrolase